MVRNAATMGDVVQVVLDILPNTLTVTIPMAVLVGILLGLSRLASDSEVTAMRACGMGVFSFTRIVTIVATAGWGLGLLNTIYVTPHAASSLLRIEQSLKGSSAAYAVQPRVFYEDFKNYVLYVQDVQPAGSAAVWKHVFLADLSQPATPYITTAAEAIAVNSEAQTMRLHLVDASRHMISTTDPSQYDIETFNPMDLLIATGGQEDTHVGRSNEPMHAMSLHELMQTARGPNSRMALIELNQRLTYPAACLVLMLVGVPLGLSSKRGGKSTGFVLCILLVFLYYILSFGGNGTGAAGQAAGGAGHVGREHHLCRRGHAAAAADVSRRDCAEYAE